MLCCRFFVIGGPQSEKSLLIEAAGIWHSSRQIFAETTTSTASLGQTGSNRVPHGEGDAAMSEPWSSAEEIAAHLGVTKDTVYTWVAGKAMPAHKVGRLWKFQACEVDEWVRAGGTASAVKWAPTRPAVTWSSVGRRCQPAALP